MQTQTKNLLWCKWYYHTEAFNSEENTFSGFNVKRNIQGWSKDYFMCLSWTKYYKYRDFKKIITQKFMVQIHYILRKRAWVDSPVIDRANELEGIKETLVVHCEVQKLYILLQ